MRSTLLDDPDGLRPPMSENPPEAKPVEKPVDLTFLGGRRVPLPAGLTLHELANLSAEEIDEKIKSQGAGIGYAALIALAAGKGETPAGTQYNAAAFLMNRAAELQATGKDSSEIMRRLRALPEPQLLKFIAMLEEEAALQAFEQQAAPLVITDRSENPGE